MKTENSEILQHSYGRYIFFDTFHCSYLVYWATHLRAVEGTRGLSWDYMPCWMQPCFSRGPFLCKCLLLSLPFLLCVMKLWDEWLAWCGGGRWHSFPTMVSHRMSCTSVLPLSHPMASLPTPAPRSPFSAFAVLLGVLGFVCLPGADFGAWQRWQCQGKKLIPPH